MTSTEREFVDDSYPESWRPREAPPFKTRQIDLTEAELWLGSLSTLELQQVLKRARGDR